MAAEAKPLIRGYFSDGIISTRNSIGQAFGPNLTCVDFIVAGMPSRYSNYKTLNLSCNLKNLIGEGYSKQRVRKLSLIDHIEVLINGAPKSTFHGSTVRYVYEGTGGDDETIYFDEGERKDVIIDLTKFFPWLTDLNLAAIRNEVVVRIWFAASSSLFGTQDRCLELEGCDIRFTGKNLPPSMVNTEQTPLVVTTCESLCVARSDSIVGNMMGKARTAKMTFCGGGVVEGILFEIKGFSSFSKFWLYDRCGSQINTGCDTKKQLDDRNNIVSYPNEGILTMTCKRTTDVDTCRLYYDFSLGDPECAVSMSGYETVEIEFDVPNEERKPFTIETHTFLKAMVTAKDGELKYRMIL